MDDLLTFLTTRYDEAEAKAKAALWAGDERWEVLPGQMQPFHRPWQVLDATYEEGLVLVQPHAADDQGVAEHIELWQPLNVLADIAAKRAILDTWRPANADPHPGVPCENWPGQGAENYDEYDSCTHHLSAARQPRTPDHVVLLLAQPYAGHPNFQEQWRVAVS